MSSEKAILNSIRTHMQAAGWLVFKNHGSQFTYAGIPDLTCHRDGETLYIEVKRPGCKPTQLQEHMMNKLRAHGISCVVARSPEDVRIFWNES
jgi:Holliday junction resolvase